MNDSEKPKRTWIQKTGIAFLILFAAFHFYALVSSIVPKSDQNSTQAKLLTEYVKCFRLEQVWGFFAGNFAQVNESLAVRVELAPGLSSGHAGWKWLFLEPSDNLSDFSAEATYNRFSFFEPKLTTDILSVLGKQTELKEYFLKYYVQKYLAENPHGIQRAELVVLRWPFKDFENLTDIKLSNAQQEVIYTIETF